MEKFRIQRRRGRRKSISFDPSHEFITDSVDDYLKQGGKITRIERINGTFESFVSAKEPIGSADDFLMDR